MALVELVLIGTAVWVYTDAGIHAQHGDPVIFSVGSIQLDSPAVWAVVCLFLWVFAFPLYLASRERLS
jgi:hypothetical protein